jgi:hypothetical protein
VLQPTTAADVPPPQVGETRRLAATINDDRLTMGVGDRIGWSGRVGA